MWRGRGGKEVKGKKKGYKESTIHSSEVHTLAEEKKPEEGPGAAFIYRTSQAGGMAGWGGLTGPAYWTSSHYPASGEVSLLPGAIDCFCSTTRHGRREGAVYRMSGSA